MRSTSEDGSSSSLVEMLPPSGDQWDRLNVMTFHSRHRPLATATRQQQQDSSVGVMLWISNYRVLNLKKKHIWPQKTERRQRHVEAEDGAESRGFSCLWLTDGCEWECVRSTGALPCSCGWRMSGQVTPADGTDDYTVQQENELEALASIFVDDFQDLRNKDPWKVAKRC